MKILNSFNSKCEITKISWKLCLQSPFLRNYQFSTNFHLSNKKKWIRVYYRKYCDKRFTDWLCRFIALFFPGKSAPLTGERYVALIFQTYQYRYEFWVWWGHHWSWVINYVTCFYKVIFLYNWILLQMCQFWCLVNSSVGN